MDNFLQFKAVSYISQVVAGMNYKIKLDVGEEHYLEIFVYKGFSDDVTLNSAEFGEELVEPPIIVDCPPTQEWQECGTACPRVCGEPEPFICTMNCVIGCQCPPGTWQTKQGTCVEDESQCESNECPFNQEYQECGTPCPLMCGEPAPLLCIE